MMKTKTTIRVETYKFSTVRLKRERATSICAGCGREITPSEGLGGGICPSEVTPEYTLKELRTITEK